MPSQILVTGGTGTLGTEVVDQIQTAGYQPVVLSRRGRPPGTAESVRWATGDLRTGEGISAAMEGVEAIVHCASSNTKADVPAARRLFDAARNAGSPHVVYISIVGVDRVPLGYYRAKLHVEQLLAASGLPWTTLRATQFHKLVTRFFSIQRRSPLLAVPSGVSVQPVAVSEVAERLVTLVTGEPAGHVEDMGGPRVRTVADLARVYLQMTGGRKRVVGVPLPGKTMRAFRRGGHLCPDHAQGHITFAESLGGAAGGAVQP